MSDAAIRAYANDKRFTPSLLERWLRHPPAERAALLQFASRLRLGENQFRDLLDQAEDIAARQGSSLAAVLHGEAVAAVLDRSLGRNETIRLVKQALRRLRYPQLADIEARLAALVRQLQLPAGARVVFPEHLEGDAVELAVTARTPDELRRCVAALTVRLEAAEVDEMFRLFRGDW